MIKRALCVAAAGAIALSAAACSSSAGGSSSSGGSVPTVPPIEHDGGILRLMVG